MSEEEIIRKCNWFIKNDAMYEQSLYDAIQGLLDLYQKEKEKNKKLTDKITELVFYYNKNAIDIEQNYMFRPATSKEQIEIDMNRAIARAFKKLLEERN